MADNVESIYAPDIKNIYSELEEVKIKHVELNAKVDSHYDKLDTKMDVIHDSIKSQQEEARQVRIKREELEEKDREKKDSRKWGLTQWLITAIGGLILLAAWDVIKKWLASL